MWFQHKAFSISYGLSSTKSSLIWIFDIQHGKFKINDNGQKYLN